MGKQLLYKLTGYGIWLLGWLLTLSTVTVTAGTYPLADTCVNPSPPVIIGSAKAICRNAPVTLTATGCMGTVVWSNGDVGATIVVKPQQTTKYTAICRAKPGCISCFAEVWKITVNTPNAPKLTTASNIVCPEEVVTITVSNCQGTIQWVNSDGTHIATGPSWVSKLQETATFRATCEENNCVSNPSIPLSVQVTTPVTPTVSADKSDICVGQSVQLQASGCLGTVRWKDGGQGLIRTVNPYKTTDYRAVCQIGSCRSDSSQVVSVVVRSIEQPLQLATTLTNSCPFQTVDLSRAITLNNRPDLRYEFRTGPSLLSAAVQAPGAVGAGTYFIFGRNADGCYTQPAAVAVTIQPCPNAIAPCLSNPATVAIQLDSIDWNKGVVRLRAQLGGAATLPIWQSDGGGLFTDEGLQTRYLLSELDRQRGSTVFTLSAPDADGSGPCVGASVQRVITAPAREIVGLSKKVSEPVWVIDKNNRSLVELNYQFVVANLGKHEVSRVQLFDDLDAAFSAVGAQIQSVTVRADGGLSANASYSGRGTDTTLITGGTLTTGQQARIWLTVQLDVSQANTLTFINKAGVEAVDTNGNICRDRSTNGTEVDPDQNGNPADNDEPTPITLHSLRPEEGATVFIPEGFSPNGDGINDLFVIQRVPTGVTVELEIYNRWGHLVYQNSDYKNDWNGTPNQGVKTANAKEELPDGTYYYQIRLSDGREFIRFLTLER